MKAQRIWSRKILGVAEFYLTDPNLILFGITGDLDNLGVFVSHNGRPLAENLVDTYNRLIGAFMHQFVRTHKEAIPSFCMIPSGEEIFALGAARTRKVADEFFTLLQTEMNHFIKTHSLIQHDDVTISFGCKIFQRKAVYRTLSQFVKQAKSCEVKKASLTYLKLMLTLRKELAHELDKAKFESLHADEKDLVIFFRNVVYTKLQEYKTTTRRSLVSFARRMSKDPALAIRLQSSTLNQKYGVTEEEGQIIDQLL